MELLVVGAGAMGRWLAQTVDADVAVADVDTDVAKNAAVAVGGQAVAVDGDERFDAVAIAVPMSAADEAIAAQADRAEEAMLDVTGAMSGPIEAMAEHAPDLERASLHPLFAPENAPGYVPTVVDADGPTIQAILEDLEATDNRIVETTPEEHDEAMKTVQAAAHTAIAAYGLAREALPPGFETPVSARLDALLEQVTDGDPGVYAEIQGRFDGAEAVAEGAAAIADADPDELEALWAEARPDESVTPVTDEEAADGGEDLAQAADDDVAAALEDNLEDLDLEDAEDA